MARYRGQKALYEVISTSKARPVLLNMGQAQRPEPQDQPVQTAQQPQAQAEPAPAPSSPAVRWHKARLVQFNQGKVELTIPYPIAVAILLALILIILAAFRLGQYSV